MVDAIYDRRAAAQMGVEQTGQVCVMIANPNPNPNPNPSPKPNPNPSPSPSPSPSPNPNPNQVCVMIHSGSRGLGHQVATDALVEMEKAMGRDDILPNDRQLARTR